MHILQCVGLLTQKSSEKEEPGAERCQSNDTKVGAQREMPLNFYSGYLPPSPLLSPVSLLPSSPRLPRQRMALRKQQQADQEAEERRKLAAKNFSEGRRRFKEQQKKQARDWVNFL